MSTTSTDPWHVPPAPRPSTQQLAQRYTPAFGYATIAVKPEDIELGDVADHTDGLMIVTAITRRHTTWTISGYNPAVPRWLPPTGTDVFPRPREAHRPVLTRDLTCQPHIRIRRPGAVWVRLTGHTKKITTHNPVKRGMFTIAGGWDATCSCGWTAPTPYRARATADNAAVNHRAEVITDTTHRDLGNLELIERLETELDDVLPWRWDHGAQAQLRGLTTAQALARLTPWADALGTGIEHMGSGPFLGDEHFLWADSRAQDEQPRLDIRAYPADTPQAGQ